MIAVVLGQVVEPALFLQYGVVGAMLLWFMFRVEKRLDDHTGVISDLAKTILLEMLSRDNTSDKLKQEADDVMQRIALREAKKK